MRALEGGGQINGKIHTRHSVLRAGFTVAHNQRQVQVFYTHPVDRQLHRCRVFLNVFHLRCGH